MKNAFISWIIEFHYRYCHYAFQNPSALLWFTLLMIITSFSAGICGLYERKLKAINPAIRNLSYDISDLYNFIDGLADLSALVYLSLSLLISCSHTFTLMHAH